MPRTPPAPYVLSPIHRPHPPYLCPKHLGQGANQAFEDIYHLVRLLTKHNPSAAPPSTELLETVFSEYEQLRIARTSALVLGA